MNEGEIDPGRRGLTKSGVAVVVGSLVILLLAMIAMPVMSSLVSMRMAVGPASVPAPMQVEAYLTYSRKGKDVTATLTVVNRNSTASSVEITALRVGTHKLITKPLKIASIAGGETIQKEFLLKGIARGGHDETVEFGWKTPGGTYSGSSSGTSTAMIP